MADHFKRIIRCYENNVGTQELIIKELRRLAVSFDKLNDRGLLEGEKSWNDYRDEYMDLKAGYIFAPYAKITKSLMIANQQMNTILQNYDLQELDRNNKNFQNESSLAEETAGIKNELNRLTEEMNRNEYELKEQKDINRKLAEKNADLHVQFEHIQTILKVNKAQMEANEKEFRNIVMQLIMLRDQLEILKKTQKDETYAVMDNLSGEIARMLRKSGIEIIDDKEGRFNEKIHCIVDTRMTDDKSRTDYIAESVSAGYMYKGNCLKEQNVVIYIAE